MTVQVSCRIFTAVTSQLCLNMKWSCSIWFRDGDYRN